MEDAQLRRLLETSPRDGYRAVFEAYANYVYAVVWSKLRGCGTREDAEEIVSDVFAELFRQLEAGTVESIPGFLGTAAKNRAITAFHRLKRRGTALPLEDAGTLPDSADVAAQTELAAERQVLLDCITALGEPDASIAFARYFYGRRAPEIARALGMSPAAVRQRLHRAVKKLRKSLEDAGFQP